MKQVQTAYGPVIGCEMNGYTVFKGIPFAKVVRFEPPQEPDYHEDPFIADQFGPICPQSDHTPGSFYYKEIYGLPDWQRETSEQCLNLNIWTPAQSSDEKLPVAVWIHGGAFFNGYNSEPEIDGEAYAKRGVILVAVNYRLGAFGYLCHPWLREKYGTCGNYGVLDQIEALRFVKKNIAAFGGDPDKVTVFGQSAGCSSVVSLLVSPLADGLYRQVVLQSAAGLDNGFMFDQPMEKQLELGELFVKNLGVSSPEELTALAWEVIQEKADDFYREYRPNGRFPFVPVIDGKVIPAAAETLLRAGKRSKVPCLIGSTANDYSFTGDGDALHRGTINWAENDCKLGMPKDYVYYMTRRAPGDDAGAFHSLELWYMFGTLDRCWRPFSAADHTLSEKMCDAWCSFIKDGDPGFPAYTAEEKYVEVYDIEE